MSLLTFVAENSSSSSMAVFVVTINAAFFVAAAAVHVNGALPLPAADALPQFR